MQVWVVLQTVREQIASIWGFRAEAVQTRTEAGAAQERHDGRGAREEFHVDNRIDACAADAREHAEDIDDEP